MSKTGLIKTIKDVKANLKKITHNEHSDFLIEALKEIAKETKQNNALGELMALNVYDYEAIKNILSKYDTLHKAFILKNYPDNRYIEDIDDFNRNFKIIREDKENEYIVLRDKEKGNIHIAIFLPKTFQYKGEFDSVVFISSSLYNYYFSNKITSEKGFEAFDFKDILQFMETKEIADFHIEAQDVIRYMYTARMFAGKDSKITVLQENIRAETIEANIHQAKLLMNKDTLEQPPVLSGLIRLDVTNRKGRTVERTYRVNITTASLPPEKGYSVSIRRLKNLEEIQNLGIEGLGYLPEAVEMIKKIMSSKKGINIVAGATNSGKSTLLAAMLNELYKEDLRILSIENPIEILMQYPQFDLSQYEGADEKFKLTRKKAMSAFLRHDPNIVLFSEIRDEELPDFVELGLRGHAAYATIHAGKVDEAILRLLNEAKNHISLITALRGIIVQDLVRKKCQHCNGEGCKECEGKGFDGVIPVYEIAYFHDIKVSELITEEGKVNYKTFFDFDKMQELGFLDYIKREDVEKELRRRNLLYEGD